MSFNKTNSTSIPPWIPAGFQVNSGNTECPTSTYVLTHFAIFNALSIGSHVLFGSARVKSKITCGRGPAIKPWKFWSAFGSVIMQILGTVATSLLIRVNGYKVDMWQLVQIWAIRPRVSWFIGNMMNFNRKWGYMNGALDNVVVEVFICSFGCVFVGRTAAAALSHGPASKYGFNLPGPFPIWYWVIAVASMAMLISTAFEVVWALWMLKRVLQTKGRAEAQDMDSLKWIVKWLVPINCLWSWLIWAAFLNSAEGAYCPGKKANIPTLIVWVLIPVLTNLMRAILDAVTPV